MAPLAVMTIFVFLSKLGVGVVAVLAHLELDVGVDRLKNGAGNDVVAVLSDERLFVGFSVVASVGHGLLSEWLSKLR